MPNIYSATNDGVVGALSSTDAATCRGDASTSGGFSVFTFSSAPGIKNNKSARGGGMWFCHRSYFTFVLTGESGTVDSCNLVVYADNTSSGGVSSDHSRIIAVEATPLAVSAADYGNCFSSGSTLGTTMSGATAVSTTAGYHTIPITGDTSTGGIKVINDDIGSGKVDICLMDYTWDYLNADVGATYGTSDYVQHSVYYTEYTGTSRDPYLDITYTSAAVTENATFFGANF